MKKNTFVYKQIYEKIRNDILKGYLTFGEPLSSVRKCAETMNVSRTTVENAYHKLVMEGFITAKAQIGYFVNIDEKNAAFRCGILDASVPISKAVRYDFRSSSIDPHAFDTSVWIHYLKEILKDKAVITSYGDMQGEEELRRSLQQYAYHVRGVLSDYKQMVVGASFQSLIYILCGIIEKDSIIGMERNSFHQAKQAFEDCGYKVVEVEMDEEGISIPSLIAQGVTVLYLNTASQGLFHRPVSTKLRKELLLWAKNYHSYIIEDDHNGELRYRSKHSLALQAFDQQACIIYIGSFSKLLLPSLRITYMVLTDTFYQRYYAKKFNYSPTASKIEQLALAHYITDGHLDRNIRRLKKHYAKKSKCMEEAILTYFPDTTIRLNESALQILVRFPETVDIEKCLAVAQAQNVYIQRFSHHEICLSFASIELDQVPDSIQFLATLWQPYTFH